MVENVVARVAVDIPLPHLDRFFDYAVPQVMSDDAVPGARVRVRFAGRLRDGFIVERRATTDADRELVPLQRVVSAEVVLQPEIVAVVRAVADHYGGSFADVVRLAVPPRHGLTENATPPEYPTPQLASSPDVVNRYPDGDGFLEALRTGGQPRAALTLAPVHHRLGDWAGALIDIARAALGRGRGALLLVPDQRDLHRLAERCSAAFGRGSFVTLNADAGPAARYRAFLAASRGAAKLVLGTRAAVFAPVADLGVIALYDDGDDAYAEPRTPGPHAREVAALRASAQHCGLAFVGYARTAEVQALVGRGWLVGVEAPLGDRRELCPVRRVAADTDLARERDPAAGSRLPHDVFELLRACLPSGPVLFSVPRAGYASAMFCQSCRAPARCPQCGHPLAAVRSGAGAGAHLTCRMCGPRPGWRCAECGDVRLRAPRPGVERTAEELGKAFPQTRIVLSSGDHPVSDVPDEPAIILATPGTEPTCAAGYAAAVLLDADNLLARPELRAAEEALRRWLAVTSLVRPAADGGTLMLVGEPGSRAVQALVRLDPIGFAVRELAERIDTGFPPGAKLVVIEGTPAAVGEALAVVRDAAADAFGPVPLPGDEPVSRITLRSPLSAGRPLVARVKDMLARRSAHKADGMLRVRVDPHVVD